MAAWLSPIALQGSHVRLEPLSLSHVPGLQHATRDGELWRLWYTSVPDPEGMAAYVEKALALRDAGTALPWAVLDADGDMR